MKIDLHCHTKAIKKGDGRGRNVTPELFKTKIEVTVQNPCLLQDDLSVPSKSSCQSFISADTVLPACANV